LAGGPADRTPLGVVLIGQSSKGKGCPLRWILPQ
jgi:hypothetical protein